MAGVAWQGEAGEHGWEMHLPSPAPPQQKHIVRYSLLELENTGTHSLYTEDLTVEIATAQR